MPAAGFIGGALLGWAVEGKQEAHGMPIIVGGVCGLLAGAGLAMLAERMFSDASACEVRRIKEGET